MHIKNIYNWGKLKLLVFLGLAAFLYAHCFELYLAPGFHYDESWAANYAHRIAFEKSFWPLSGMSPFTLPWSQYWSAIFFKLFSADLYIYRLSQILAACIALLIAISTLWRLGKKRAAICLPWIIASAPVLITNHRFAIEMTSFHFLCFALFLCSALRLKTYAEETNNETSANYKFWQTLFVASALIGVTSHLIFLAPVLSLLCLLIFRSHRFSPSERKLAISLCVLLLPFFVHTLLGMESKSKGLALVLLDIALLIWFVFGAAYPSFHPKLVVWIKRLGLLAFVVFGFNLLFFWDGHWAMRQNIGYLKEEAFVGSAFVLLLFLAFATWQRLWREKYSRLLLEYLLITTVALGLIMLKPATRYFEIAFLCFALLICLALEHVSWRRAFLFVQLHFLLGVSSLWINYFKPALAGEQMAGEFRMLSFKDNAQDFLSKQFLVHRLARLGCRFEDVHTNNYRLESELKFLALNNWFADPQAKCPWWQMRIEQGIAGKGNRAYNKASNIAGYQIWDARDATAE